eukprot:TRINITY_DN725_c0_g1_i1.p1 TRINITY_DN725_c0_g1~~TRINITY_DN725_c0_g1_i1.p1  ORF type:complete len:145 (-),score=11.84 TRINITY_DN725_c0_g1_i1:104-538(-)
MRGDSKSEEETSRLSGTQPHYGTFQGNPQYSQQTTVIGIPQPAPPPGVLGSETHYAHGYQAVPGYPSYQTYAAVVVDERQSRPQRRLPCCGIGIGWALFICGFLLGTIPWYVGAFLLICVRQQDQREKPGLLACTIGEQLKIIL